MVTICQKCGDKGFSVALIYCDSCQVYAQHRYCLDVLPATFDEHVTWFCLDCEPKVQKLSTINKTIALPSGLSHSVNSKNVRATQSRIRLKRNLFERLKNKMVKKARKNKKKKRKDISGSVAKVGMQIFKESPSLQLDMMYSGEICEKGVMVGQELQLVLTDGANSSEDVECVNPSLWCHETHCNENCEGQKVGQELGLHLKDGTNLAEEAISVNPSLRCNETHCGESCEGQKLGHKLILDLKDGTKSDKEVGHAKACQIATSDPSNFLEQKCYVGAQPIIDPIWRGSLCIRNKDSGAVVLAAHLSSLACSKVCEEAKLMPKLLYAELFRRPDVWPKGFEKGGPTDQNIALFFFSENGSDGKAFKTLVDSMIDQDLAMRSMVQNAELLLFTSTVLPMPYKIFQEKFYLWGVFRRKQASHVTNAVVPEVEKTPTNALTWDRRSPVSPLSNNDSYGSSSLYSFCASVF